MGEGKSQKENRNKHLPGLGPLCWRPRLGLHREKRGPRGLQDSQPREQTPARPLFACGRPPPPPGPLCPALPPALPFGEPLPGEPHKGEGKRMLASQRGACCLGHRWSRVSQTQGTPSHAVLLLTLLFLEPGTRCLPPWGGGPGFPTGPPGCWVPKPPSRGLPPPGSPGSLGKPLRATSRCQHTSPTSGSKPGPGGGGLDARAARIRDRNATPSPAGPPGARQGVECVRVPLQPPAGRPVPSLSSAVSAVGRHFPEGPFGAGVLIKAAPHRRVGNLGLVQLKARGGGLP